MQYKDGKNYTEFIREIVSDSGKLVSNIDIECKNTKRVLKKILTSLGMGGILNNEKYQKHNKKIFPVHFQILCKVLLCQNRSKKEDFIYKINHERVEEITEEEIGDFCNQIRMEFKNWFESLEYEKKEEREREKEELDEKRYEHTIGVMYTAASLAMRYGVMMHQAILAGLLHDCAKAIPNDEKLELCKKYGIIVSDVKRENPSLLHAKLGAYIAREKYGVMDDEVLHAIYVHTTGEPGMSTLDKILFVADYIEPNRDSQPNLEYVRKIAFWDLNQAMEGILYDTLEYLKKSDKQIDSMTQKTYEYYASTKES